MAAITDTDRKHADLAASYFSQLGIGFVIGASLQLVLIDLAQPASTALLFMTGLLLLGASHILVELGHGDRREH